MARKLLYFDPPYGDSHPPSCEQKCNGQINPESNCPPCPKPCFIGPCTTSPIQVPSPLPPPLYIPAQPPNKHHVLSIYYTVPLGILAATFFLFTCYTVYKFYSYWFKSRRERRPRAVDEEEDPEDYGPIVDHPIWYIRTVGLQPSVISAITVVKYKKGEGVVEGSDCSVCLTEFEEDETLRLLPKCNHAFHLPCIDTWLRSHTNCPMCRAGIVITSSPPLQEANSENPGVVGQALIGDSGSNSGIENENSEFEESRDEIGEKGNEDVVQPVRRSVSFDSLSASIISAAVVNAKEPIVKTGSASCSAKVFLSRHSSRRN